MTNGLIHGYKGIEYMIEAMPRVLQKHPDAIYLIEGKPHPGGWGVQGYYNQLKQRATELGLIGNSVIFNNMFSEFSDLLQKLDDAYIYVNPYTDHTQSVSDVSLCVSTLSLPTFHDTNSTPLTMMRNLKKKYHKTSNSLSLSLSPKLKKVSGTVAMALSTGSTIVSTPYPYAVENLNNGIGVFVPFRDSNKLAEVIIELLDKPALVVKHNFAAHNYAQNMTWSKVAQMHLDVARTLNWIELQNILVNEWNQRERIKKSDTKREASLLGWLKMKK
jgi:glycosyltransferase involved in cell wall biosynthesis